MPSADRPNIIVTIADDQRYSALGALGIEPVLTPNLDRLARRGTMFTRAHCLGSTHGAVCAPSRAMLHTGRFLYEVHDFGMTTPRRPGHQPADDDPQLPTLGQQLRDQGYNCFAAGKWHNGPSSFARSFNAGGSIFFGGMDDHYNTQTHDYDPAGAYPDDAKAPGPKHSSELFADALIDYIESYDDDKPFFGYLAFTAPHDPRDAPPEFAAMYPPQQVELPPNFAPGHPFHTGWMNGRDERLAAWPRTGDQIAAHIAGYYAMVTDMDHHIGRIHAALERKGLLENTVVVHTADHGLAVGQHGLMGKQNLYDHSCRVPLVIAGPGVAHGERRNDLVYQHDLHPTLLAAAGVTPSDEVDFIDLETAATVAPNRRDTLFCTYETFQRMVKDDRYKLIEYFGDADRVTQLFDLSLDPWETHNLASHPDHAPQVERLRAALDRWQDQVNDPTPCEV